MTADRRMLAGVFAVSLAGIFWGAMCAAVQYLFGRGGLTPSELVAARLFTSGVIFALGACILKPRLMFGVWKNPRDIMDMVISGILLFMSHSAFFSSIYYSNAGTAAILITLVPLFAGLWQTIAHRKPMTAAEVVCFVLATAGVSLIITDGDFSGLKFSPLAVVWGMVCVVLSAAYSIQPRRVIGACGVLPVAAWSMLAAGISACLFSPPWRAAIDWSEPEVLGALSFIVLFGTIAAFSLYLFGLKCVSPVIAGLLNCMEPLSAIFFSIVLLGDVMGFWQSAGVVLVISNVILIAISKKKS